jgi:nitrate/nitrite-specific signal transduction histidine kinase
MKRRFVLAFVALFALFASGIGISLVFIWRGTTELREVLGLHQIEDLRQTLSRTLERSRQDLEVSGTVFANQLDEIIANVEALDSSVQSCFGCHHEPRLRSDIERVAEMVEVYKDQYGTFITAYLNPERRQQLQFETATTAERIEDVVDGMLLRATPALKVRTEAATAQVERSWTALIATLALTFVAAIVISFRLTRSVTGPLDRLVQATERIAEGELGHLIEHDEPRELGVLMNAFNTMSRSLHSKTQRIERYVERLHRLNHNVVALCAETRAGDLFARQVQAIDDLMEVELRGCIVKTGLKDVFLVSLSRRGESKPEYRTVVSKAKLGEVRAGGEPELLVAREGEVERWPFGAWAPEEELRSYLVRWIEWNGSFQGALLAVNRRDGDFGAEDSELLIALGQAIGLALDGIGDIKSLQAGMELPESLDDTTAEG